MTQAGRGAAILDDAVVAHAGTLERFAAAPVPG
jgi:hypothetical protein